MTQHVPHTRIDGRPLLFDDCPGCERHTKDLGISLDRDNWFKAWDLMIQVEYASPMANYESNAEQKLCRQMYILSLILQRHTDLDAELPHSVRRDY